jgi:hypothetical protein
VVSSGSDVGSAERRGVVTTEPGPAEDAAATNRADEAWRGDRPRPREPRCTGPSMTHRPPRPFVSVTVRSAAVRACWSGSGRVAMTRRSHPRRYFCRYFRNPSLDSVRCVFDDSVCGSSA